MDPLTSAQDLTRCDLCKTNYVQSYCDYCNVNLCKPCIGEHISDEYEAHRVVSVQEQKSALIYPKCETHNNEICKIQCKNCNVNVCCFCMASKQHKEHDYIELTEVYELKKAEIQKDSRELKNVILPAAEEIVIKLEYEIANLSVGYDKIRTEISKQGNVWHEEIDKIIENMNTEITKIKKTHQDILKKHLDEINHTKCLIIQNVKTLKKIVESKEVKLAIENKSKNDDFTKLPPEVWVSMPKFISKSINREVMCSNFGEILPLSTSSEPYRLKQRILVDELDMMYESP